jgi:protein-S-isoprenylcysteine O-methyltransferase Ste14
MAGKLAYKAVLTDRGKEISLGGDEAIIIRFKGRVPIALLLAHILVIFAAMLFSTRAGIAALDRRSDPRRLAVWTAVLFFIGGFILGPLMQKFAFDAWWTGFPLGKDLTDSKTLFAMLA